MRPFILLLLSLLTSRPAALPLSPFRFEAGSNRWTLSNGFVEATFQLTSQGTFEFLGIRDVTTRDAWLASPSRPMSPISLRVDGAAFNAQTAYRVVDQFVRSVGRDGEQQTIVLEALGGLGQVELQLEMYPGQPVLRISTVYRNTTGASVVVTAANMLPLTFEAAKEKLTLFRVNQWVTDLRNNDFQPVATALDPSGRAVSLTSGSGGQQFSWFSLRDASNRGLFAGWEFDGLAVASARHLEDAGYVQLAANVAALHHPVGPGGEFPIPPAFIGLYHGDWDEAGYRTQRFADAAIAKPMEDPRFPYVGWDSWSYGTAIDEVTLRLSAERAAQAGVELFIVDLGWAQSIGDWHADPVRFPNGLRALSDHVHSLGMKFGLHFAFAEAAPESPVLRENPDWTSSRNYNYYGALSLCLSNRPTRNWLVGEAVRIIDEYDVDWILQDGQNMVKECTKTTHSHHPADSNYSNAVEGLNAVVEAVQKRRPRVMWENCENGGSMMTYKMLRNYATSITNDASGALCARRGVFGATYPFPPRYADRYMPDTDLTPDALNSYLFGGPWMLMIKMGDLTRDKYRLIAQQIASFKALRKRLQNGKVFHLTPPPAEARLDAIQSYDAASDSALAVVSRGDSGNAEFPLRARGLQPARTYQVRFTSGAPGTAMTGAQILSRGVPVSLPNPESSEVVVIDPLR